MIDNNLSKKENLERLIGIEIGKIEHKYEMAEKLIEILSHNKIMEITGVSEKALKKMQEKVDYEGLLSTEDLIKIDYDIGYEMGFEKGYTEERYKATYRLLEIVEDIEKVEKISSIPHEEILKIAKIIE